LQDLVQLGFLLLQLLQLGLQLPGEDHVVKLRVLLDLVRQLVELVLEVLAVEDNLVVLIAELIEFLAEFVHSFLDGTELALVVLSAHFVLLELAQEGLEFVPLKGVSLERVLEFIVGVAQLEDLLLVFLGLLIDALDFIPVLLDELDVIPGDLIVVVFKLGKGIFVVLHQLVDMQVLPFFELMDFDSEFQLQLFLHLGQL
jgi:hypothetical protein